MSQTTQDSRTDENDNDNANPRPKKETAFHNSGGLLQVPGFGRDVNTRIAKRLPLEELFRHGLTDFTQARLVAREIAMLALMDSITDKPRWHEKVYDESIVEKWRAEAIQMPLISPLAWDWCLRELRENATFFAEHGFTKTLETGSACAKADELIDAGLREELLAGVAVLLDADEDEKDWHPGSDNKVLNLVHPSLFPLAYGLTEVLPEGSVGLLDCVESCGKGKVAPQPSLMPWKSPYGSTNPPEEDEARCSTRFQWLPAEVKFTGAGSQVQFMSYINNLHPVRHKDLYSSISKVVSKVIPMWNHVLVKGWRGCVPPRIMVMEAKTEPPCRPSFLDEHPYDRRKTKDALLMAKTEEYLALPDAPRYDDVSDDEEDQMYKDGSWKNDDAMGIYDAVDWKFRRIRRAVHPEPGDAFTYEEWKAGKSTKKDKRENDYYSRVPQLRHDYYQVRLEKDFADQGLQVIVKLASVELTPDKPTYEGGDWHLEGMMNEHITATAIYYYDVDNISPSRLSFRAEATVDDDLRYEQNDHSPLEEIFGASSLANNEPAIQNLGALQCKSGRLLAFPNTLQHRVEPFELLDRTRAGHRRFLVLWLVDPNYRIASTANVPPQQHDWWAEETVERVLAGQDLAVELQDMIREHAMEHPMSLERAKALRLELMLERTRLMPAVESMFESYNLCEH